MAQAAAEDADDAESDLRDLGHQFVLLGMAHAQKQGCGSLAVTEAMRGSGSSAASSPKNFARAKERDELSAS